MNAIQATLRIKENRQVAARFLKHVGMPSDETYIDQLAVFLEALGVMGERQHLYGEQWREAGGVENLRDARRKTARQLSVISNVAAGTVVLDASHLNDAIDAINYLGFAVQNLRLLNFDRHDEEE